MIWVENIETYGFDTAVRAMRNPMSSWNKSDSCFAMHGFETGDFVIGMDDMELMQKLIRAGVEHRTFMRMMQVSMDITAPLYWWKEMDRYCVGKSQISTSTMHTIHKREFTMDDFSHDHLSEHGTATLQALIADLNIARNEYIGTKNKQAWWDMIQLLPTSYNQKRTILMSYEVVMKIIRERRGHRLDEWRDLIVILLDLPYMKDLVAAMDGGGKYIEAGN